MCSSCNSGQEKPLDVAEQELPEEVEEVDHGDDEMEEKTEEESTETTKEALPTLETQEPTIALETTVDFPIPKMKVFSGKTAKGLRIRSEPSLTVRMNLSLTHTFQ